MKVLLAIDGSPHSQAALTEFATRPWPDETEMQVLTVLHAPIPLLFEPTLVFAAAHMEELLELRDQAPALVKAASDRIRHVRSGRQRDNEYQARALQRTRSYKTPRTRARI